MDTKKLEKWAELLLDTGKRNPLINFSDNKPLTVEVLLPDVNVLFDKIDGTTSFEVYDPKIAEDDDEEELFDSVSENVPNEPNAEQLELKEFSSDEKATQTKLADFTDTKTTQSPKVEVNAKEAYLEQYSRKIRRQNQMLLYSTRSTSMAAIKKIDKKAREYIEETGVNVAYMAFGFIHWKESAASGFVYQAPILLIPIQLEQASGIEPYFIAG